MTQANILIVEDNGLVAAELTAVLEDFGYGVPAKASNGPQAIQKAVHEEVDLVLMDIMLQGDMDGIEAAQQILKQKDLPVIFLSAYSDEAFLKRAAEVDPYGYLVKPFRENELRSSIEMALNKFKRHQNLLLSREEKEAERIRVANFRLQHQNRELEQFAYVASHDLQTPLRTISNYTQYLQENYWEHFDETGQKCVEFLSDATSNMSQLIKGLLDYSLLGQHAERKMVDCNALVERVKETLASQMEEYKVDLIKEDLPSLLGCESELVMLFQHLIHNAIKFRKPTLPPVIHITAESRGENWLFSVKDNGIGIAPRHQEKIFQIFQRLHKQSHIPGNGIGLAHCRKIVELHDGTLCLESTIDQGSTFYFTLPK